MDMPLVPGICLYKLLEILTLLTIYGLNLEFLRKKRRVNSRVYVLYCVHEYYSGDF